MAASVDEDVDLVESDDYYAWLGLSKEATSDEINSAFRKLSRTFHPDKHASDPIKKEKAELHFTKIKKAHEVLCNPHTKAIYDTMGIKGLETEGWEVVSKTKTPQEIIEEYERLEQDREERRLNQRTNPKGSIIMGINATDLFDRYEALDSIEYRNTLPSIEISNMSISQSVECPLTSKDTAVLAGNLTSSNGNGQGNISLCCRRVMSHRSWAEFELGAGNGSSLSVRGFRTLWKRGFGTMSGTLQMAPNGEIRPGVMTSIATQLDKNTQGRISWNWGMQSAMTTMVVWDNENHHVMCALQLGLPNTFAMATYTRKFLDHNAKVKGSVRLGTFGVMCEYGCEKKITQFSHLGASVSVSAPGGVTLKIKLLRGQQQYVFPIHLSEGIVPEAIFYGTVVPLVIFGAVKVLLVNPFIEKQKERDLRSKKEANIKRMAEKQRDAESALELMKEMVDRCYEVENEKNGLIINKALFGKLEGKGLEESDCINVTRQMQALVKDSKIYLPSGTAWCELPGFYDPCVGETKTLVVTYHYRGKLHICTITETEKVLIPSADHFVGNRGDSS